MRHAFWCNVLTWSAKQRREIFIFEVLSTKLTCSSKSFLLCLYVQIIRSKQAKVHFAYFVNAGSTWNNCKKNLTLRKVLFYCPGGRPRGKQMISALWLHKRGKSIGISWELQGGLTIISQQARREKKNERKTKLPTIVKLHQPPHILRIVSFFFFDLFEVIWLIFEYLTITISRARVGYEVIDSQRGA